MHRATAVLSLVLLVSFAACGSGASGVDTGPDAGAGGADAGTDAGPTVDLTEAVFDPTRLLRISIEMDPADWDELRQQSRSLLDVLGSSCLSEPPPRPFTYFKASVTIDGERVDNVGVRKKGFFGSLDTTKPSLKVKFSEYDDTQKWSGTKRLTLNNDKSDPSHVNQCIGYGVFTKAGVAAPRCNFATVSVNGEKLGVFTNVESLKKAFLARHFQNNDGNMYEGALSDFRDGWVKTFQKKTNKLNPDRSDVEALVPAMQVADSALVSAVEPLLDVDAFIDFWATELLVGHADGYGRNTNNFYMYHDPTSGKFYFIPWGIDSVLNSFLQPLPWEDQPAPPLLWAEGILAQRLYAVPETRAKYLARLQELLDTVWDDTAMIAEIRRMRDLIRPEILPSKLADHEAGLTRAENFVRGRSAYLQRELDKLAPVWDRGLREPWCIAQIGDVSASFATKFGSLGSNDPWPDSSASVTATLNGSAINVIQGGATSGYDDKDGSLVVQVLVQDSASTILVFHVVIADQSLFAPNTTIPLDWLAASAQAARIDFSVTPATVTLLGIVGEGSLTLIDAGTADGDVITGTLTSKIFEPLF